MTKQKHTVQENHTYNGKAYKKPRRMKPRNMRPDIDFIGGKKKAGKPVKK